MLIVFYRTVTNGCSDIRDVTAFGVHASTHKNQGGPCKRSSGACFSHCRFFSFSPPTLMPANGARPSAMVLPHSQPRKRRRCRGWKDVQFHPGHLPLRKPLLEKVGLCRGALCQSARDRRRRGFQPSHEVVPVRRQAEKRPLLRCGRGGCLHVRFIPGTGHSPPRDSRWRSRLSL